MLRSHERAFVVGPYAGNDGASAGRHITALSTLRVISHGKGRQKALEPDAEAAMPLRTSWWSEAVPSERDRDDA